MATSKSTVSTTNPPTAAKNAFKQGKDTAGTGTVKLVGLQPKDTAGEEAS